MPVGVVMLLAWLKYFLASLDILMFQVWKSFLDLHNFIDDHIRDKMVKWYMDKLGWPACADNYWNYWFGHIKSRISLSIILHWWDQPLGPTLLVLSTNKKCSRCRSRESCWCILEKVFCGKEIFQLSMWFILLH